ncbi:helix-turn-helix domain-containing protein [Pelagerythrobacter rhizovicinus]|uniref:XRE family transcriptional regulator n=1 Tax=Pelagerythrobacter rhizovicinus TaxID=2268576 RepID=A0A4Q2KR47_9SPHN|nr:helix-turn-helix transcriptional regulator [Pelagerythrobacter rhizovicinus]RXZ66113.1 XRE family transcriptional regulator [Pelagerythrobacter rhizovicinus]
MEQAPLGEMLREWRARRKVSQLDLALASEISARHLSFIETGRSAPSTSVIDRLARELGMPMRAHNAMRIAAGYAPAHRERPLDDPQLSDARAIVEQVLAGHEPYPALAVDRAWNLVAANAALPLLLAGVAPELLEPPVNVLRVALDPRGIAPQIANFAEWRAHLLARLSAQIEATGDPVLERLEAELRAIPYRSPGPPPQAHGGAIAVPLQLDTPHGRLSFISTTTVFGSPLDITLSEIAIEAFFPADRETGERLRAALG